MRSARRGARRADDACGFHARGEGCGRSLHIDADSAAGVIVGFSGGEKKCAEILQMALPEARDGESFWTRFDSGLDIDALKVVSRASTRRGPAGDAGDHALLHLNHIVPDEGMLDGAGRAVMLISAPRLEAKGYAGFDGAAEHPHTSQDRPAEAKLIEQLGAVGASAAAERLSVIAYRRARSSPATTPTSRCAARCPRSRKRRRRRASRKEDTGRAPHSDDQWRCRHRWARATGLLLAVVPGSALSERDDLLVRLNMALAAKTLKLEIEGTIDAVIHIDRRRTEGDAAHMNDSVHLFVGADGRATVVETFSGTGRGDASSNRAMSQWGKGAELTHILSRPVAVARDHLAVAEYHVAADAKISARSRSMPDQQAGAASISTRSSR